MDELKPLLGSHNVEALLEYERNNTYIDTANMKRWLLSTLRQLPPRYALQVQTEAWYSEAERNCRMYWENERQIIELVWGDDGAALYAGPRYTDPDYSSFMDTGHPETIMQVYEPLN